MSAPFKLADHISPISLDMPGSFLSPPQLCYTHGWGQDSTGKYQEVLQGEKVFLLSPEICQSQLRENSELGPQYELQPSLVCAGGTETCRGDEGSPLVCQLSTGLWYQAGVVSYTGGCGREDVPALFASVASVSCWIDKEVEKRDIFLIGNHKFCFRFLHSWRVTIHILDLMSSVSLEPEFHIYMFLAVTPVWLISILSEGRNVICPSFMIF